MANKHPLLSVMARYYFQVPGKRFRPTVVLLMGRATGGETGGASPRHIQLAEIVEMIHTASLAHDDVLDEAAERRGRPSINAQFGNKVRVRVLVWFPLLTRGVLIQVRGGGGALQVLLTRANSSLRFWWGTFCWRARPCRWRGCGTTR